MKLADIHINPKNPRFITKEQFEKLCQSIASFPKMFELRPIVIDENNIIQGGNMRYRALKKLGYKEIPDTWVKQGKDLSPEQWREFVVKDNLGYGEWDMDLLAAEYKADELLEWGLDLPDLVEEEKKLEVQDDAYEIPEKVITDIQPGDIYQVGPHRIMCGDATKATDHAQLMNGKQADLVITDPPYNVDYGRADQKILNDKQTDQGFYKFLFDFYKAMLAQLKEGASFYIFHADSEGLNFRKALKANDIDIKQCLVWVKNSLVLGRQDYQWRHEPCLYGWKPGAAHFFIDDRSQTTVIEPEPVNLKNMKKEDLLKLLQELLGQQQPTTVIYHDKPHTSKLHPTMKPVTLIGYLMKNSSRMNNIVLDSFGGSGSTLIAAHQLRRRCYTMDLEPGYCQIMIDRIRALDPDIKVRKLTEEPGMAYFGIMDGSFIFGDLLEAFFTQKLIRAHRMDITTLSMSQENIDSLATLLLKGYVKELNLTVSDYFYAHERKSLIPYIQQELDIDNRFQLAVSGNHTKTIAAELTNGIHLVFHGSANLRSSGNLEQVMIQDSKELYDFITGINDRVIEKFKTINKSVRRAKLWHGVVEEDAEVQDFE